MWMEAAKRKSVVETPFNYSREVSFDGSAAIEAIFAMIILGLRIDASAWCLERDRICSDIMRRP